nr:class D sortase [[Bacillus] enclensis]
MLLGVSGYHLTDIKLQEKKALEEAVNVVNAQDKVNNELQNEMPDSYSQGDVLGILKIPKLTKELPIIEGTEEEELEKGVGHYSDTKLPGEKDRIFLAGHRDTVFKSMGEIVKGDLLTIEMASGTHEYEVIESFIVKENDLSVLQPTSPEEILTLSTCYPFEYLSSTEDRYIINARRIN